jgi:hypothetical protein
MAFAMNISEAVGDMRRGQTTPTHEIRCSKHKAFRRREALLMVQS